MSWVDIRKYITLGWAAMSNMTISQLVKHCVKFKNQKQPSALIFHNFQNQNDGIVQTTQLVIAQT